MEGLASPATNRRLVHPRKKIPIDSHTVYSVLID